MIQYITIWNVNTVSSTATDKPRKSSLLSPMSQPSLRSRRQKYSAAATAARLSGEGSTFGVFLRRKTHGCSCVSRHDLTIQRKNVRFGMAVATAASRRGQRCHSSPDVTIAGDVRVDLASDPRIYKIVRHYGPNRDTENRPAYSIAASRPPRMRNAETAHLPPCLSLLQALETFQH
jgi:hypothetical protein